MGNIKKFNFKGVGIIFGGVDTTFVGVLLVSNYLNLSGWNSNLGGNRISLIDCRTFSDKTSFYYGEDLNKFSKDLKYYVDSEINLSDGGRGGIYDLYIKNYIENSFFRSELLTVSLINSGIPLYKIISYKKHIEIWKNMWERLVEGAKTKEGYFYLVNFDILNNKGKTILVYKYIQYVDILLYPFICFCLVNNTSDHLGVIKNLGESYLRDCKDNKVYFSHINISKNFLYLID